MHHLCFFCLVYVMPSARLFICALWSPAGKGLTFWLLFVVFARSLSLSHWYPGSGVVLDFILIPDLCTLTYFVLVMLCWTLCSFLFCNHPAVEARASSLIFLLFLGVMLLLLVFTSSHCHWCVIVAFTGHTPLFYYHGLCMKT